MDMQSWTLLRWLSLRTTSCMIVATTRPPKQHQSLIYADIAANGHRVTRHVLGALARDELGSLVASWLGEKKAADISINDALQTYSNGFPFLAVELLREASEDFENCILKNFTEQESQGRRKAQLYSKIEVKAHQHELSAFKILLTR